MTAIRLALLATTLLATAAPSNAQQVAGTLIGFDGKPAVGATVLVHGRADRIAEVITDEHGRFHFAGGRVIGSLVVQFEAIELQEVKGVDGQRDLVFRLAGVPHWTIRGHVVDPAGTPAVGVDVIARDERGGAIATVTTDGKGAYRLRSNQEIADLHVDPLGWAYTSEGPFRRSRGLAIDLRLARDQYSRITGRVIDLEGRPVAGALVVARLRQGRKAKRVGAIRSQADGTFCLWTNRTVTQLTANYSATRLRQNGDWPGGEPITLDARQDQLVRVSGTVVDQHGKSVNRALVYAHSAVRIPRGMRAVARTNNLGRFHLELRIGTAFLVAVGPNGQPCGAAQGPWTRAKVVLRPMR